MYPDIEASLDWLTGYLNPVSNPASPLAQLSIAGVWNDDADYGVVRRPGSAPDPEEVRVSYLSGRAYQGVIYISTQRVDPRLESERGHRFYLYQPFEIVLFALYDGSDENHQALVKAFNDTLLSESDMLKLGDTAVDSITQPVGGELPDLEIARIQVARANLRARYTASYS